PRLDSTDPVGDGDADVLSASEDDDTIAWYENLGGAFGPRQVITTSLNKPQSVYATDLDGDGDADVLAASEEDSSVTDIACLIVWYENLGGAFGPQQVITFAINEPQSIYATDLDGDGDADVLSASEEDDKVAWYENLTPPSVDCNGNGISDVADIANGMSLDTNGDGIPDECQGTWMDLGNALGGMHGAPLFIGSGPLLSGAQINLWMAHTLPFTGCYLVVGFLPLNVSFKGGSLVPSPDLVLPFSADGFGAVHLPAPWPDGVPPNFSVYMQWWVLDAAGPKGFAASNALSVTTP
ncbi:MAG: VCBS repeat-containing protein, partial [Planctomycetota bacterium]|nr:VCBS repeat-containing protein [Planctomycetota bacterium]